MRKEGGKREGRREGGERKQEDKKLGWLKTRHGFPSVVL